MNCSFALATLGVALLITVAACGGGGGSSTASPAPSPAVPLTGTAWTATQIGGDAIQSTSPSPTAMFTADMQVSGTDGCNQYNATYTLSGNSMTIGLPSTTKMACSGPAQTIEGAFLAVIPEIRSYLITGTTLELLDKNGKVQLSFNAGAST